jgi:uroporphyrinogen-III synthase
MGRLSGKRVVNTRDAHQAAELDRLLEERGAVPLPYPCIAIGPPLDRRPLVDALTALAAGRFDWLVLTSANTVAALERHAAGGSVPIGPGIAVAAIGPATAAAARRLGLEVAVVPNDHHGLALAATLPVRAGARVLLPASEIARPELATALAARGAEVTTVSAYRTVVGEGGVDLPRLLADGEVDAVTFASSSAVDGLVARLSREGGAPSTLREVPLVCIGERTRQTALERGFDTAVAAERSTLGGLIAALERRLSPDNAGGARWSRAS